ncbi:hypothetical protein D9611_010745 [Ephemerocybe angulata]|uniref:Uncharacterized protein n=1 Tax=Ephemerocybe angulata TaxID=980116 RepID=A0A8H5F1V8_9AGAR|nr:hypothetical protein D9611_010745 [Tulosesus angulatus]
MTGTVQHEEHTTPSPSPPPNARMSDIAHVAIPPQTSPASTLSPLAQVPMEVDEAVETSGDDGEGISLARAPTTLTALPPAPAPLAAFRSSPPPPVCGGSGCGGS